MWFKAALPPKLDNLNHFKLFYDLSLFINVENNGVEPMTS